MTNLESEDQPDNSTKNFIAHLATRSTSGQQFTRFFWVAGALERCSFNQQSQKTVLDLIDVNFRNPLIVAHWAWRHQLETSGVKSFSVIASTAGISTMPRSEEAVYAASKAAQVSFTRALGAAETGERIRTSLFCPGRMQTELWQNQAVDPADFAEFNDPGQVGAKIVAVVATQSVPFLELVLPRGSLRKA